MHGSNHTPEIVWAIDVVKLSFACDGIGIKLVIIDSFAT